MLFLFSAAGTEPDVAALVEDFPGTAWPTNSPQTNLPPIAPDAAIDVALRQSSGMLASTNLLSPSSAGAAPAGNAIQVEDWEQRLEMARRQRLARLHDQAAPAFIDIVLGNAPESVKRTALLELAIIAQEDNHLPKAQQIFAHYLTKWPDDPSVPEIILRQGLIFRQMGLTRLALTKFYSVMTSALVLKSDHFDYYQRLVLQAQTEIAETYFQQGKYRDSAEYFARLLKLDSPLLNRPQVHFKLVRSLSALGRHEEVAVQATDFLSRYAEAVEQPEVRFHLATALKQLGRTSDSLQQVMQLLQAQQAVAQAQPAVWAYWQQRTGNEIANQLYKEGDFIHALEVYVGLAALSTNAQWQLPVQYQIGLTFERLRQPEKAVEQYTQMLARKTELAEVPPALDAILDMARWRKEHLLWRSKMENTTWDLKRGGAAPQLHAIQQ